MPPYPPQAVPLLVKVLSKAMDTSLAVDKIEIATLSRDANGKVWLHCISIAALLRVCNCSCVKECCSLLWPPLYGVRCNVAVLRTVAQTQTTR